MAQPDLGDVNGGIVTGYFLNDGVTAVLSIPSFDVTAEAVKTFSSTIGQFLNQSTAAGLTRFIIDLQRNDGGSDLLATDAFRQVGSTESLPVILSNQTISFFHRSTLSVVVVSVRIQPRTHWEIHSRPTILLNQ